MASFMVAQKRGGGKHSECICVVVNREAVNSAAAESRTTSKYLSAHTSSHHRVCTVKFERYSQMWMNERRAGASAIVAVNNQGNQQVGIKAAVEWRV